MEVVRINKQGGLSEVFDFKYWSIRSENDLDLDWVGAVDFVLFDVSKECDLHHMVHLIRRHENKSVYLKPLFAFGKPQQKNIFGLDGFVDGQFTIEHKKQIERIRDKNDLVRTNGEFQNEIQRASFKQLCYLFSREKSLEPIMSRHAHSGYLYPFLQSYFGKESEQKIKSSLEMLDTMGMVDSHFHSKTHTCIECESNYLNISEVCPKCHSHDLTEKTLVHHFRCAHVDVIDNFETKDGLHCPKCDKTLRHIGIDYDKPSSISVCGACHNEFQESDMVAACFDCGNEQAVHELNESVINNYTMTYKGECKVLHGMDNDCATYDCKEYLPLDLFRLGVMQASSNASSHESILVNLNCAGEAITKLRGRARAMMKEDVISMISEYTSDDDSIASSLYTSYWILLNMGDMKKVRKAIDVLQHNLQITLQDSLESKEVEVNVTLERLTSEFDSNLIQ